MGFFFSLFFLNCWGQRYKSNCSTCSWKAFQRRLCFSALVSSTGSIRSVPTGGERHVFTAACSMNIWCHYVPWETLVAEARREVEEIPTWHSHLVLPSSSATPPPPPSCPRAAREERGECLPALAPLWLLLASLCVPLSLFFHLPPHVAPGATAKRNREQEGKT